MQSNEEEDAIAAKQFVDYITAIADRWGFDVRTGNTINPAASPATTEQARIDVVSLVAVTIAYARKRYPTLRDRFHIG